LNQQSIIWLFEAADTPPLDKPSSLDVPVRQPGSQGLDDM